MATLSPPPIQEGPTGKEKFTAAWIRWFSVAQSSIAALLNGNINAGANVTVTGTWPNQTVSATGGGGGGGGVTVVTGSGTTDIGVSVIDGTTTPNITVSLLPTGVTGGTYNYANVTTDANGRITGIAGNTAPTAGYVKGAAWSGGGAIINASGADLVYGEAQAAGTIKSATVLGATTPSGSTGSCSVEVWKTTFTGALPTTANKISASAPPTITGATKSKDSTLTGWTTAVAAGDIFGFKLLSNLTFTWVAVILEIG
jgi:hypothetical protein